MLDQPFQVDLVTIFPFKAHLVVTYPMHPECSLLACLLHTRSQRIACIRDDDIASLQLKMVPSFGSMTIAYLNMSESTCSQVLGTMQAQVIPRSCRQRCPRVASTNKIRPNAFGIQPGVS
jgi:hypothetical protein